MNCIFRYASLVTGLIRSNLNNSDYSVFNTRLQTTRANLACLVQIRGDVLSKSGPSLPRLKAGPGLVTDYRVIGW